METTALPASAPRTSVLLASADSMAPHLRVTKRSVKPAAKPPPRQCGKTNNRPIRRGLFNETVNPWRRSFCYHAASGHPLLHASPPPLKS